MVVKWANERLQIQVAETSTTVPYKHALSGIRLDRSTMGPALGKRIFQFFKKTL